MYSDYDPTLWQTWSNTEQQIITPAPSSSNWDSLVNTLGSVISSGIKTYGDIYKARYSRDMKVVPSNQTGLILERTGYPINRIPQTGINQQIPISSSESFLKGINKTNLILYVGFIIFLILFLKKG